MRKKKHTTPAESGPEAPTLRCGFCLWDEHGTHGKVQKEYHPEYRQLIAVCRKHTFAHLIPQT